MTSHHATGELIEVGSFPPVVPSGRAADNSRVGDAAGNDNVGPARQRVDDAEATEVGVGADISIEVA